MKEHEQNQTTIIKTHYPVRKAKKRWVIAESRKNYEGQRMQNRCVEAAYHEVIAAVKQLMGQIKIYYDIDLKTNSTDGATSMHSFINANFYWRLDCTFLYDYEITYSFSYCPYEAQIREMMKAFPLDRVCTYREFEPDFKDFYNAVMNIHIAEFTYIDDGI